jgi:L-threonylcarbamoyladenylate synthase
VVGMRGRISDMKTGRDQVDFKEASYEKGTKIIKVDPLNPEIHLVRNAADIIRNGGTVAFPTETVYGLGANALSSETAMKIFAAKKRPADNPLIVHVSNKKEAYALAEEVPEEAESLMDFFWPGPLTLVLRKSSVVSDVTTAGLDTVAIRMPKHNVALALIKESKVPIAAPSANLAGKPSPTMAEHVKKDLYGRIDAILDAGPTNIGVESTVVDMTSVFPVILRPGGITHEQITSFLGKVKLHPLIFAEKKCYAKARALTRSPGMKHKHYSPNAKVIVVEGEEIDRVVNCIQELSRRYMSEGKKVGILATESNKSFFNADLVKSMGNRDYLSEIAKNLFLLLREFDDEKTEVVIAEGVPLKGFGLAIMNRLRRAAGSNIIKAR